MPWFRVDDSFAFNPKVISAGNAAIGAWTRMGSYCAAHLTDGLIPDLIARMIASGDEIATLTGMGMLVHERDGYRMHQYLRYQPSKADVEADRAAARERMAAKRKTHVRPNKTRTSGEVPDGIGSDLRSVSGFEGDCKGGVLPGKPTEVTRKVVDQWVGEARSVLDALNLARRRLRSGARGISPTYDSLKHIAERLDAGKSVDDCLHVIEVCESECRADAGGFKWFDAVTPFRPENFERKVAADVAGNRARTYRNFHEPRAHIPKTYREKL